MAHIATFFAMTLAGCAPNIVQNAPPQTMPLDWLAGCWQTDDGVEEVWVRSKQGDQLFGYSVTSKDGQRVFFEQLRIDIQGPRAMLYAYPKGVGPTAFEATLDDPLSVEFVNARNDYPQRIRYAFADGRIKATIAMLDYGKQNSWRYRRCKPAPIH